MTAFVGRALAFRAMPPQAKQEALLKDALLWWGRALFPRSRDHHAFCCTAAAHCLRMREGIK